MMFKNSVRLLMANFSTVWKLILYYLIVIGITIGLIAPFFGTLSAVFNSAGEFSQIAKLLMNFNVSMNFTAFVTELQAIILAFADGVIALFASNVGVAIYITALIAYIFPVLLGLADLAVGQTLFGYMSSLTKYSFSGSYARMLGRSFRFQLFKNLLYLPFNILIITVFMATLRLTAVGGLMVYFLPVVIILPMLLLIALKRTLFSGWMPAIVVYNCNMFLALGKGMKAVFKRFFIVLSTALIMTIIIFGLGYLFGTYALLVIIPLAIMFFYVFEMVMFYSSQGMRFYVDIDTIVKPRLLEESDSFNRTKNLI